MESSHKLEKLKSFSITSRLKTLRHSSMTKQLLGIPAMVIIDLLAIIAGLLIALYFRDSVLQQLFPQLFREELLANTLNSIWWFPLVVLACLVYENLYQKRLPFWTETETILKAVTLSVFLTIVWLYLAKVNDEISRTVIVLIWLTLLILLPLFRYYGKLLLVYLNLWNKPVIICGSGLSADLIINAFKREKTIGYEIIGLLEDNYHSGNRTEQSTSAGVKVLGSTDDAERIIKATGVKDVVVALSEMPTDQLVKLTNRLQQLTNNVLLVPGLFGLALNGIELNYFFEEQTLLLQIKNRLKSTSNRLFKNFFDLTVGLIFFTLSLPFFMIIALAIRLESKGPVFYIAPRIGQGGELFKCYKFRSMRLNAKTILEKYLAENKTAMAEWQRYQKLTGYDPRVTKVGALLRRFSIDELPQLLNVLKGEMSLVGPRPYLPRERNLMAEWLEDITVAKPGITGLWQVSGRNNISFSGRLKLDSWYMKNWSPWLDLILLLRTIKVVIKANGAH
jgi:Undecaprenyl-phosphate galactose phosphotransferase WbaP